MLDARYGFNTWFQNVPILTFGVGQLDGPSHGKFNNTDFPQNFRVHTIFEELQKDPVIPTNDIEMGLRVLPAIDPAPVLEVPCIECPLATDLGNLDISGNNSHNQPSHVAAPSFTSNEREKCTQMNQASVQSFKVEDETKEEIREATSEKTEHLIYINSFEDGTISHPLHVPLEPQVAPIRNFELNDQFSNAHVQTQPPTPFSCPGYAPQQHPENDLLTTTTPNPCVASQKLLEISDPMSLQHSSGYAPVPDDDSLQNLISPSPPTPAQQPLIHSDLLCLDATTTTTTTTTIQHQHQHHYHGHLQSPRDRLVSATEVVVPIVVAHHHHHHQQQGEPQMSVWAQKQREPQVQWNPSHQDHPPPPFQFHECPIPLNHPLPSANYNHHHNAPLNNNNNK